jgi:MFS family permease
VSQSRSVILSSEADVPRARHARWGVLALFAIAGVLFSGLLTRLPSIREQLAITEGQLGRLLMFGALGSLASLLAAGAVITRFGTRRVLTVASIAAAAAFLLLGIGSSLGLVWMVALGLAVNGLTFAFVNVSMNSEGTAIERHLGHTIMPQFHAAFSIGAAAGALVSSVLAAHDVSPLWQLTSLGVVALAVRLVVIPFAVFDGHAGDGARRSLGPMAVIRQAASAYRERRTILIGLVILASALSEGAASAWIAIAVVDGFGRTEAVGGQMYFIFVAAMILVRLSGNRLVDRFGRVAALRVSAVSVVIGLSLFALAPAFPVAALGLLGWGFGAALAVPIGFSAASDESGRAPARIAAVSSFASIAGLTGPPLIGYIADFTGARHALLIICLAMVVSVSLAGSVRRLTVTHS